MKNGILYLGVLGAALSISAFADESKFYAGAGFGVLAVPKEDGAKFSDANNASLQLGYKITENFAIEGQFSQSTKAATAKHTESDIDVSQSWWDATLAMNPGETMSSIQTVFPRAIADASMNIDAKVQTTALYGVYRSSGNFYVKVKAGYLSEKTTLTAAVTSAHYHVEVANSAPIDFTSKKGDDNFSQLGLDKKIKESDTDSGFSGGLGVGYKFNEKLFSELEYTKVNDDFNFYSLSINYAF